MDTPNALVSAAERSAEHFGTPPLEIMCFASLEVDLGDPEITQAISTADLIVALGNVELGRLAEAVRGKPALCVLGGRDQQQQPPPPFRLLHGNGVTFKGWRIAGLSGDVHLPLRGPAGGSGGMEISERDASALVSKLPPCDLLLSHAPPATVENPYGFQSLGAYLDRFPPIYHFHASQAEHTVREHGKVLVVGVSGVLSPPPLTYA